MNTGSALLKALLKAEFYDKNKAYLNEGLFPREIKGLYNTLAQSHEAAIGDLTLDEVYALHCSYNPVLSEAQKTNVKILIDQIKELPEFSEAVTNTLIKNIYKENKCIELAQLLMDMSDNRSEDYPRLDQLLSEIKSNDAGTEDELKYVSTSITDLLELSKVNFKWKFNLPDLQEVMGGIGPGVFLVAGGRPESGKTALELYLTFGPGGFLDQGAKVHIFANEESANKLMLRGISSYTGMTREEMEADPAKAAALFAPIKDSVSIIDSVGMTTLQMDRYLKANEVDILIVDQLDKVNIAGNFARDDQRLKQLYITAREWCKRFPTAVIGVSQVSAEADGKLYYGMECMDGSRTGKGAECDAMILVGMKNVSTEAGIDDGFRILNIPKNKLTGNHTPVKCVLNGQLSRYVP